MRVQFAIGIAMTAALLAPAALVAQTPAPDLFNHAKDLHLWPSAFLWKIATPYRIADGSGP